MTVTESTTVAADPSAPEIPATDDTFDDELVDEVLVEEISIDGMCGVY